MTYDWSKHLKSATIEGRAVEGGGGRAVLKTLDPKGLIKLNTGMSFVIDSLSYFEGSERNSILDLLDFVYEVDKEFPFLTWYNRKEIMSNLLLVEDNSEAADFDLNGAE